MDAQSLIAVYFFSSAEQAVTAKQQCSLVSRKCEIPIAQFMIVTTEHIFLPCNRKQKSTVTEGEKN